MKKLINAIKHDFKHDPWFTSYKVCVYPIGLLLKYTAAIMVFVATLIFTLDIKDACYMFTEVTDL